MMTRAEVLLWRYLKAHHINELGFRRQVPIRGYIADFVCHEAWLVVELDGETHDFASRQRDDRRRDAFFASQGYLVLRFPNDDVLQNLEGVVSAIREAASLRMRSTPPSLSLPHKGGGNPQTAAEVSAAPRNTRGAAR
jgi:very-short-patch-repair endonuclease